MVEPRQGPQQPLLLPLSYPPRLLQVTLCQQPPQRVPGNPPNPNLPNPLACCKDPVQPQAQPSTPAGTSNPMCQKKPNQSALSSLPLTVA